MKEDQKNYRVIPEGDARCVWMSAGILSYQLCNRSFDCDDCPLDAAVRQHFSVHRGTTEPAELPNNLEELPRDCQYTSTHYWMRAVGPARLRIGIEAGLARALTIPKTIILPEVSENITSTKPCLWFILDDSTIPLKAFASGTVTAHNSLLSERPYKIYYHPYDQGWLFEMTMPAPMPHETLDAWSAQQLFDQHEQQFRQRLSEALQGSSVGATLQDGGQLLQNLPSMLGPKKYFELVKNTFLKGTK